MKVRSVLIMALFSICLTCFPQAKSTLRISGSWMGSLQINGVVLRVIFNIKLSGDTVKVSLDSPDQGAKNIPLKSARLSYDSVFIDAPSILGYYKGLLGKGDSVMTGIWTQAGADRDLILRKLKKEFVLDRPQEPKSPFPYRSEDVVFHNDKANIDLAGTLTLPEGNGLFPAVVLVTGSGPQNRDEELLGHKPFLVIADYLTRNGIAVLRYDDRGVAKSKGIFSGSTSLDFADDAEAAFSYLLKRKEINPEKIGIAGHSEGGMIAPIVASRNRQVAFIVLLAGPGETGEQIVLKQSMLINRAYGLDEEKANMAQDENRRIYAILKQEPDANKAGKLITALMQGIIDSFPNLTEENRSAAKKNIMPTIMQVNNKWFRTFLVLDPTEYLSKVTCPVLALNGEKDLQVPCDDNLSAIEKILRASGNKNFKTVKLEGLNHLFQHCTSGLPSEYGEIEETFAPEALKAMKDWILSVTR